MSFLIGNCCLKLNYLICGSNDISSKKKKKKKKLLQETIVNDISSNNKIISPNHSSPITFYKQHHINVISPYHKLQQQNYSENPFKSNKIIRIRNSSYDSSLNSFINHRLSDQSYSTLNNEIILKDVILYRHDPSEQLGLTLCYGITSQSTTNIYIEKVEEKSLAARQGKLQHGDQIIKINNQRVTNRDQAIQLISGVSLIILQIIRFQFIQTNLSQITPLTEDDSGIMVAWNTDLDRNNQLIHHKCSNQFNNFLKKSNSLSCLILNHFSNCLHNDFYSEEIPYRRCLSLNDLKNSCSITEEEIDCSIFSIKDLIRSQSLFGTTTDNEKVILKPLPLNNHQLKFIECRNPSENSFILNQSRLNKDNNRNGKCNRRRRRYREERLKETRITTDDEVMSELKQGRYWTREQRKQQFQRSKQSKQKTDFIQQNSTRDDFNLLNRIFLRENEQELKAKPYLAFQYKKQSNIEKQKLKQILQQYPIQHYLTSHSTTTASINSTQHHSSIII